jgi:flagellar hook-associated protein 2
MGIQIAGLASGLNWQNIINELVAADSAGENAVKARQTTVNNQVSALGSLNTDLATLENSVFSLEDPSLYSSVTASSSTSGSTWSINATSGTPPGSYAIDVQKLATASVLTGASGISSPLSSPNSSAEELSTLTLASLHVATPITAGTFTVNGQQIAITTSESLQAVFTAIEGAAAGVTASYDSTPGDPNFDKVTLSSTSGNVVLGAANDTSNFLQAMGLENNGTATVTSASALGSLVLGNPISSAGIQTALTGQDSSGNGSFMINGVSISYNTGTDSLSTLIDRINSSAADVTASYDATDNRMVLTNNATGSFGVGVSDTQGNLMAALGLTGSGTSLALGVNAVFSVNGGPNQVSTSNSLTPAQLGVTGLNVAVNSEGTQTINVATDTSGIQSAITSFINDFNQVQTDIANDTVISVSATGSVSTSILSSDHEVGDWGSSLEMTVFGAGSGLSGAIKSLDNLGIDFNGTTGQLTISDSAKLQQALTQNTSAVQAFFQTAKTGFGSIVNGAITDIEGQVATDKSNLSNESTDLGNQITTMQAQLAAEQAQLEAEFTAMETMESQYQSEMASLNAITGSSSSGSSSSSSSATNGLNNSNVYVNGTSNASSSSTSSTNSTSSTG